MSQDDVCASPSSRASERRTGSSGSKRKRTLLQRHLLSRMDDLQDFVLMPEDEREGFCRVLLET
ncbi:retrotransposon protein [Cucumis melo var. makuwa]|uniref:Retrotransposon protein n=1 Tax=Cucumis melo var. makuwa TaxID=1194695 RepID=A0A5A7UUZ1_CUCMM|nr:retrotransposon protein [Cucumis melo var. makuwa]TYK23698.1 retrotransposon protein [Cucumis melo var. makuwa]